MNKSIATAALSATLILTALSCAPATSESDPSGSDASANSAAGEDSSEDKQGQSGADKSGDYNVEDGLALGGYDPVAYFPDHGGEAKKGDKTMTSTYEGVTYRFSSKENKKAFDAKPEDFTPMYGGWCAWAMAEADGKKVDASPKSFTLEDGRLYMFYDGFTADTRKSWEKKGGAPKLKATADKNWTKDSGEPARGE